MNNTNNIFIDEIKAFNYLKDTKNLTRNNLRFDTVKFEAVDSFENEFNMYKRGGSSVFEMTIENKEQALNDLHPNRKIHKKTRNIFLPKIAL